MSNPLYSVPEFLSTLLTTQYGAATAEEIMAGYACVRPVTFRVNTLKTTCAEVEKQLSELGFSYEKAQIPNAYVLRDSPDHKISATPLYENGEIYLQSLSSMLPPFLLQPKRGENVLDMTAAPGGKTALLSALSGGEALLTAVEKDKIRADRLSYNLKKQGVPNVSVLNQDALTLSDFFRFDKILLDAPCSGSGTLNLRYPTKISPKLVENSAKLQEKLLKKALKLLKSGGTIVYSTCSVLKQENEEVVKSALKGENATLIFPEFSFDVPCIAGMENTVTVPPTQLFEGFFCAVLKKGA